MMMNTALQRGDSVLIFDPRSRQGKLGLCWKGPFQVVHCAHPCYDVSTPTGTVTSGCLETDYARVQRTLVALMKRKKRSHMKLKALIRRKMLMIMMKEERIEKKNWHNIRRKIKQQSLFLWALICLGLTQTHARQSDSNEITSFGSLLHAISRAWSLLLCNAKTTSLHGFVSCTKFN